MQLTVGGQPDQALIESGMQRMNEHFEGADISSVLAFAMSYLASMVVIHELYANDGEPIDLDAMFNRLERAIEESRRQSQPGDARNA